MKDTAKKGYPDVKKKTYFRCIKARLTKTSSHQTNPTQKYSGVPFLVYLSVNPWDRGPLFSAVLYNVCDLN